MYITGEEAQREQIQGVSTPTLNEVRLLLAVVGKTVDNVLREFRTRMIGIGTALQRKEKLFLLRLRRHTFLLARLVKSG